MIESRGGESIKGTVIADRELIELGRRVVEALGVRGPCTVQVFRDSEVGLGITDVNTRFGGAFPAPMYAALPGRTYPELIVRMARGERIEPHVGEFRAGISFTRYFWQLELDEAAAADRTRHRRAARSSPPTRRAGPAQPVRRARAAVCTELSVRPLEAGDAEELYALSDANRAYLAEFMPWAAGQTFADSRAHVDYSQRRQAANNGFDCAILRDDRIVGCVGYHSVSWQHRSTSIGYWLAESEQGRGTMTLAARALVDHAFAVWDLNRVEIAAAVDNARSRAVARRLGFTEEGTRRQAERVGSRYLDHVVHSMLASEWAGY